MALAVPIFSHGLMVGGSPAEGDQVMVKHGIWSRCSTLYASHSSVGHYSWRFAVARVSRRATRLMDDEGDDYENSDVD